MGDDKTKTQKVNDRLDQAGEIAAIGKSVAPPGVRGRIQDAEDAIEIAKAGVSIWGKINNVFRRKGKKK